MKKIKIFDEAHEKDLEKTVNAFLRETDCDIIELQFRTAISVFAEEQIYCFSCMIYYEE